MNKAQWVAQGLLAAIFLFAGGMKLVLPVAVVCLAAFVAYSRWRAAPLGESAGSRAANSGRASEA